MSILCLILDHSAKACYLRFITNIGVNLTEYHINLSVNIQLFMLTFTRFSDVTGSFLQVKSVNPYISDVRKIILHVVSMWDMEIPPEGKNFGSGTRLVEKTTTTSRDVRQIFLTPLAVRDTKIQCGTRHVT
jgi:hypothetical protein